MCIFSGRVRSVSDTNIFARLSGRGTQCLIYSMTYSAERPVAMILPLPVADPGQRMGVRFINLKPYSDFFNDMANGFPVQRRFVESAARPMMAAAHRPTIHVESVGDFIASYVPTLNDFDRLDPKFRLPRSTWNQIPVYHDYGFAVFQLKDTAAKPSGPEPLHIPRVPGSVGYDPGRRVHPMAFEFHSRLRGTLYFPTVHIHDETVHSTEDFNHSLFLQDPGLRPDGQPSKISGPLSGEPDLSGMKAPIYDVNGVLRASTGPASKFIECAKTQGAVDPNRLCYKINLNGELANRDTLVRVG